MSTETEKLIKQVINDVNKKYELKAFDKGHDKVKEQGYNIENKMEKNREKIILLSK